MSIRTHHWVIAFCCALALQVGAAVSLLPSFASPPVSAGTEGIDISLALAGPVGAGGQAADLQPMAMPELPKLPEPPPPEPKPKPERKPKPKAKPVATPQPTKPAAKAPATRSAPELAEVAAPQAAPPASMVAGAQPSSSAPANSMTAGNRGQGGGQPGGGSSSARQSYYGQLAAALNRHKRYPYAARRARQEGIVKLRFVIDARGNVIEHGIDNSSGYRALDDAVIEMVERASPLPPIPAELGRDQLAIVLPIEFSLRHP